MLVYFSTGEQDARPTLRRTNAKKTAKFQVSSAPGVVPPPDHTWEKLRQPYSSSYGRRGVRSEIARY